MHKPDRPAARVNVQRETLRRRLLAALPAACRPLRHTSLPLLLLVLHLIWPVLLLLLVFLLVLLLVLALQLRERDGGGPAAAALDALALAGLRQGPGRAELGALGRREVWAACGRGVAGRGGGGCRLE